MTKEQLAVLATALGLIGIIFSAGQRMGTLQLQIETQSKQIDKLTTRMDEFGKDFNGTRLEMMRWMASHDGPTRPNSGGGR